MQIVCPHCNFTREVDSEKIPPGVKRATCPQCRTKFEIFPESSSDQSALPADEQPAGAESAEPSPAGETGPPPLVQSRPDLEGGRAPDPEPPPLPSETVAPWEAPGGSFFRDLFSTIKMVLIRPGPFFRAMPKSGGLKSPLVFAVITGSVGGFFGIFWDLVLAAVSMSFAPEVRSVLMPVFAAVGMVVGGVGAAVMAVLMPVFVLVGMFVGAGVLHLFLWIVRGAGGGFEATFRVLAYASAAQLLNIVPIIGDMASWVWGLVVAVIGLSVAHRTGVGRVLLAIFGIPVLLMLLLAVLGVVLAIVVGGV